MAETRSEYLEKLRHDLLGAFEKAGHQSNLAILSMLALCGYVLVTALQTDHSVLLNGTQLKLPVIDVAVSVEAFFYWAPLLIVAFHGAILLQQYLAARQRATGATYLLGMYPPPWALLPPSMPLFPFFRTAFKGFGRTSLFVYEFAILVVIPFSSILVLAGRFEAYHSLHHAVLFGSVAGIDAGLIVLLVSYARQWPARNYRPWVALLAAAAVGILLMLHLLPFDNCDSRRVLVLFQRHLSVPHAEVDDLSLRGRNLQCASLPGARLNRVDMTATRVDGGTLQGADLRTVIIGESDETGGFRASWSDVDLRNARVEGLDMSYMDLRRSDLRNLQATQALFVGSDMTGVQLDGAELDGARMDRANLDAAVLRRSSGLGLSFRWGSARGSDFLGARWPAANLRSSHLTGARLEFSEFFMADFSGADLTGADFLKADLRASIGIKPVSIALLGTRLTGACLCDPCPSEVRATGTSTRGEAAEAPILTVLDTVDLRGAILPNGVGAAEPEVEASQLEQKRQTLADQLRASGLRSEDIKPGERFLGSVKSCLPPVERSRLALLSGAESRVDAVYEELAANLLSSACQEDGGPIALSIAKRWDENPDLNPWFNASVRHLLEGGSSDSYPPSWFEPGTNEFCDALTTAFENPRSWVESPRNIY